MKKYIATYGNSEQELFLANNIKEAKKYAQAYKRHNIKERVKTVVKCA